MGVGPAFAVAARADAWPSSALAAVQTSTDERALLWLLLGAAAAAATGWVVWVLQGRALGRERERSSQLRELELQRLAAAQARQAKEIADAANRAKGEFLATMSHEIRTPLNGVIGTSELMLETPLNEQQREYMATVRSSAEALLAIVNDILDFSKIEEGKVVLEHTMFDLRQPAADVLKIVSARIGDRALELVLDFAPDVPACVHGDPARLRQVLLNLVSNAVKFTARGHVLVRVQSLADKRDGSRAWLKFSVTDTGIGIPAETRVRLFEKFTQADASTTRKFGGTGLGLAISKRLVGLMGGEIGLESDPGHGSNFWFTLPFQIEELPRAAPTPPVGRVLVVDDLEPAGRALASMLESLAVKTATALTVDDAVEKLQRAVAEGAPFEVAMIDQSLASEEGGAWVRAVRTKPELAGLRLILVAYSSDRIGGATIPPEFAAVIAKPVLQVENVLAALREARGGTPAEPGRREESVRLSRHGLRVLVAEDNSVNRAVVGGMLKKLGCVVEFAENGAEAVAKSKLSKHDIIFMDCLMPEMDGWTATLEIRRLDSRTPIVATTANATSDDRARCMKVGMNDYLSKPLRMAEMVRVMERWVG